MTSLAFLIPAAVGLAISVGAYFRGKRYERMRDQATGGSAEFRQAVARMNESVTLCLAGVPAGMVASVAAYYAIKGL